MHLIIYRDFNKKKINSFEISKFNNDKVDEKINEKNKL